MRQRQPVSTGSPAEENEDSLCEDFGDEELTIEFIPEASNDVDVDLDFENTIWEWDGDAWARVA